MRKRTVLVVSFLAIAISTVLGFTIASNFWECPPDLTPKSNLLGIITLNFERRVANTRAIREDMPMVMKTLVPQALGLLPRKIKELINYSNQTQEIKALEIEWKTSSLTQTPSLTIKLDGKVHSFGGVPFPVDKWLDTNGELRAGVPVLHDLFIAVTFVNDRVASFCLFSRIIPFTRTSPSDLVELEADTRYLWDKGFFQINRAYSPIMDVKLALPKSNQSGTQLWQLPDTLSGLFHCVEQHLDEFSKKELPTVFSEVHQEAPFDYISLGILRQCKLQGYVYPDRCGCEHKVIFDSHKLPSSSIPLGVSGICYSVFGL